MLTHQPILHQFSLMLLLPVLLNLQEQMQGCGVVLILLLMNVVERNLRWKIVEAVSNVVSGFHFRRRSEAVLNGGTCARLIFAVFV